jgi:hypothetical protein
VELLEFRLPPYARTQYASLPLKEEWQPIVMDAMKASIRLERETVMHGLRACYTDNIRAEKMADFSAEIAEYGLMFFPIRKIVSFQGFGHSHEDPKPGDPFLWHGVITRDLATAQAFAEAYKGKHTDGEQDHDKMGELLGYPKCCRDFFHKNWTAGYVDPIWQQAEATSGDMIKKKSKYSIRLADTVPWQLNNLLRYVGVRAVPHIPCSHDCEHSFKMANDWIELGRKLNIAGLDGLTQLLQMPVEWNALKGIAFISTPVMKIETTSVPCYPKYVVQREGSFVPSNSPSGLTFPWNEYGRLVRKKKVKEEAE